MQRKHGIDDVPVCGLKSGGGGDIYKRIKFKLNVCVEVDLLLNVMYLGITKRLSIAVFPT